MTTKLQQTLINFFLLFVCLTWIPSSVLSQSEGAQVKAGHIVVGSGRLVARAADGTERRLRRRAEVYAGDTIVVGKNAFVQIRFTDGGLFSLRPDSEFKVSEYRHQEQEAENGKVVFELLKGGLRTISGSIGKKNRENYQLKTPVSTIGIRGTHYGVRLCTGNCTSPQGSLMSDGLYGGVVDGAISVTNQSGEGIIGNDQYFHVETIDAPLQPLLAPPGIVFDPAVNGVQEQETEAAPGDNVMSGDGVVQRDSAASRDSTTPGGAAAPSSEFAAPDDSQLMVASTTLDNPVAVSVPISGTVETTVAAQTGGAVDTAPAESAISSPLSEVDTQEADTLIGSLTVESATAALSTLAPAVAALEISAISDPTLAAAVEVALDPFPPLGPGEGPAPLWSAAVIAAEHGTHGGEAHITAQKGTTESELYIDANNNVVRVVHNHGPDCFPCGLDKGTATLTNDSMPAGGFTMLQPGEQVFWGRWQGGWQGVDSTGTGTGMGSWHFMYSSNVTSMTDLNNLQVNNVTAHFSQWSPGDGTVPTDQVGNPGWYAAPPSMDVNFGTRAITNYQVGISIGATGYYFAGTQAAPVTFAGPGIDIPLNVSCSGCAMSTGSGNSAILFVGTDASHAINSIEMHTDDFADTAVGTALLTGDHH